MDKNKTAAINPKNNDDMCLLRKKKKKKNYKGLQILDPLPINVNGKKCIFYGAKRRENV